ncbi:MAG: DUF87 domain-containing protein [Trueperaceae bacterium]|nr:DUF87 domain-containing protein [Trueperaceae bacterium]
MDFEKLGVFYLGLEVDPETFAASEKPLLYDARDLTTHAVIVGMTGSGKTGLGIGLIEEAAIDGIPVLVIDPKGDMGNLALTFPNLEAADFEPWVDQGEAERSGLGTHGYAAKQAESWRAGLAASGQGPDRIERLRRAATVSVYTPGSVAGRPISILRSFSAPPAAVLEDRDLLSERLSSTATGLLSLLGQNTDPLGREHVLITTILEQAWRAGNDVSLAGLVHAVQEPPFRQIGVMDLETVFPSRDRTRLAMALNNLLAAPSFEAWTRGAPLDIQELLYEPDGKPRVAVVTLSHLSDAEREFFMTLLLSEVVAWTRSQSGTSSLRALVYIDELFGFLPPVSEPPTKKPLLTLLKQARAFGVGLALSTQNPVDLDYKALSNAGTWFIGRLQTERDKRRLIDGLKGASGASDSQALEAMISALPKRTFLMNSVHQKQPVAFQTRWVMSYLAGPLSRDQIRRLSQDSAETLVTSVPAAAPSPAPTLSDSSGAPPALPRHLSVTYLPHQGGSDGVTYFPLVLAAADVHYSSKTHGIELTERVFRLVEPQEGPVTVSWAEGESVALDFASLSDRAPAGGSYAALPQVGLDERAVKSWGDDFVRWARTEGALTLWRHAASKLVSRPGEEEREFRLRCSMAAREGRDAEVAKVRQRFASKVATSERRVMTAQQSVGREQQQLQHRAIDTASSIFGAILGRGSRSTAITGAIRKASSGTKDLGDVQRANEKLRAAQAEHAALLAELENAITAAQSAGVHAEDLQLETATVRPSSRDVALRFVGLAWVPHRQVDGRWVAR